MAVEGKERGCGLVCPSDVESAAPRPQLLDLGGVRVEASDGLQVEVVDSYRRIAAHVDVDMAGLLCRYMLSELPLLGDTTPTMTALYALRALRDAAAKWLHSVEQHRRELERKLERLQPRLEEWRRLAEEQKKLDKRLREIYKTLDEKCGDAVASDCRDRLRRELGVDKLLEELQQLNRKLWSLRICDIDDCRDPPEAVGSLKLELQRVREAERRIRITALALAHAWRALAHPEISDLEQLYSITPSNGGPLDRILAKTVKAEG